VYLWHFIIILNAEEYQNLLLTHVCIDGFSAGVAGLIMGREWVVMERIGGSRMKEWLRK